MSPRRRGFTLIEILTVVGIVGVLVALAVVGFRAILQGNATRTTKVELSNLQNLVTEFEVSGRTVGELNQLYPPVLPPPTPPLLVTPLANPGDVGADGRQPGRFSSGGVVMTQRVMGLLISAPKNKTAVDQFGTDHLVAKPGSQPGPAGPPFAPGLSLAIVPPISGSIDPPLLADAWHNPIIFVPAAGLAGVVNSGKPPLLVTAPDNRPFWASAGADGDFSKGDDNVYSFDQ